MSDKGLGELELSASPVDPTKTVEISGTYDEIERLTANLRNLVLVQYTRELKAPITAGEIMGKMTYVSDAGEVVEYNLLATRSILARQNRPPSLADIIAMTEADPNPFPPITVEIVLIVLSPLLIVTAVILIIRAFVRSYKRHYTWSRQDLTTKDTDDTLRSIYKDTYTHTQQHTTNDCTC
jgi:hypothetical protein